MGGDNTRMKVSTGLSVLVLSLMTNTATLHTAKQNTREVGGS